MLSESGQMETKLLIGDGRSRDSMMKAFENVYISHDCT